MAMPAHLTLQGEKQGNIGGSCDMQGREESILVYGMNHGILIPRSPTDGLATGKRVHGPLSILKEYDKSSPKLYQALCTGEHQKAMGLPAPEALFGNLQLALTSVTTIAAFVDRFGARVTVGELIGAGTKLELLGTIGACSAAYYVGAVIGSIAVATGRSIAGGVTMADVLFTANHYNLNRHWLLPSMAGSR